MNQVGSIFLQRTRVAALQVRYYKHVGSCSEKMNAALLRAEMIASGELPAISASSSNPEFELLLVCCRKQNREEFVRLCKSLITNDFDWEIFLTLAQHHRLISRAFSSLSEVSGFVPEQELESLRFRFQTHARQSLLLNAELFRIIECLKSAGIKAFPYKGPVLAQFLYGDVTARQFGDLDLLIHKSDLPEAKAALMELGYRASLEFTAREDKAYLAAGYEYTFDSERGRNLVELKWQILPQFYSVNFDIGAMFERAITVDLDGYFVRTFCVEDLFLVLCVHAAKHAWGQLSLLCDIAQLVKTQSLDWAVIRKRAFELGIQRIVAVNLLLINRLLRLETRIAIEERTASPLTEPIALKIKAGEEYDVESFTYCVLMMKLRERWTDRVRFLWRLVFTPSTGEWSAVRLPAFLFPMYRVVRVWRLIRRFATFTQMSAKIF